MDRAAATRRGASAALVAGATVLATGANYVSNLLTGRWLPPERFAEAAVLVTITLILTAATTGLQLAAAIEISADGEDAAGPWMRRARRWGVGLAVVFLALSPFLARLLHLSSPVPLAVLAVGLPCFFTQAVGRGWAQGRRDFGRFSVSLLAEAGVRTVATAGVLLAGLGPTGVAAALAASFAASRISLGRLPAAVRSDGASPLVRSLAPLLVAQVIIANADVLVVAAMLPDDMAFYAAVALVGRVVIVVATVAATVVVPDVAAGGEGPDRRLVRLAVGGVLAAGLFISAVAAALGSWILPIVLGPDYADPPPLLGPYALASALYGAANLLATVDVARRGRFGGWMLAVGAVVQTLACIAAAALGSAAMVVWVQVVVMGALVVAFLALGRLTRTNPSAAPGSLAASPAASPLARAAALDAMPWAPPVAMVRRVVPPPPPPPPSWEAALEVRRRHAAEAASAAAATPPAAHDPAPADGTRLDGVLRVASAVGRRGLRFGVRWTRRAAIAAVVVIALVALRLAAGRILAPSQAPAPLPPQLADGVALALAVPAAVPAGEPFDVVVDGVVPETSTVSLDVATAWGTSRVTGTAFQGTARITVPAEQTRRSGRIVLRAASENGSGTAMTDVEPGPAIDGAIPLTGPRVIIADGGIDLAMVVGIPTDHLGNPMEPGTEVAFDTRRPDGALERLVATIDTLLAHVELRSGQITGLTTVRMETQGATGPEMAVREAAGPPAEIRLIEPIDLLAADGRQLVAVRTEPLLDELGNEIENGTVIEFRVTGDEGITVLRAPAIEGRAQVTVAAPRSPGVLTATASASGVTSPQLDLLFENAVTAMPVEARRVGPDVVAEVGPALSLLGGYLPDGTPVGIVVRDLDGVELGRAEGQLDAGRARIAVRVPTASGVAVEVALLGQVSELIIRG